MIANGSKNSLTKKSSKAQKLKSSCKPSPYFYQHPRAEVEKTMIDNQESYKTADKDYASAIAVIDEAIEILKEAKADSFIETHSDQFKKIATDIPQK